MLTAEFGTFQAAVPQISTERQRSFGGGKAHLAAARKEIRWERGFLGHVGSLFNFG